MKRYKYKKELPRLMYSYFLSFDKSEGAPSFSKFARKIGATLKELEEFRKKKEFERAYAECNEIRRDYLIDSALNKRADGSVVKFLLTTEYGMGEDKSIEDNSLLVTLEVLSDKKETNEA